MTAAGPVLTGQPTWPPLPDTITGVVAELLAADWPAAIRLAADWPARHNPNHPSQITQMLLHAGITHPAVLLAGILLRAVRDGGCPLTRVQQRFGDQVAVLIERQLPLPDRPGSSNPHRSGRAAVPPQWLQVARELPLAAEVLCLADLCVLRGVNPHALSSNGQ